MLKRGYTLISYLQSKTEIIYHAVPLAKDVFYLIQSSYRTSQLILLCRCFQFFASDERIKAVRKMIMAATPQQRKAALDLLLPYQRSDFEGIFRAMDGKFSVLMNNIFESKYLMSEL